MIVATAGHVDHGKTSLVKALTDIDTDSLAEEKRRGMSIDLGFAHAEIGVSAQGQPLTLGFVDVPGHERFVRNMLAGVAAIDLALLVVAADDGVMPQTREHLAILLLLGVPRCVVALTKVDRVAPQRLAQVGREVADLLATAYAGAPLFALVATDAGDPGVLALRQHLASEAALLAARSTSGHFRLAVDRSFALAGAGRIVTGAVLSGRVQIGDELVLSPHGISARVRSIQVGKQRTEQALAGQRCALNLAGVDLKRREPVRGDWVLAPAAHAPTDRLDVRLQVLASESRPLPSRQMLQLHIGAAAVNARVAALAGWDAAPGSSGLAQLVLESPIAALHGDRFVLRDPAAGRTLAGGQVVDPFGPARGRDRPARALQLAALALPEPAQALAALLAAEPGGVDLVRFALARNLRADEADALILAQAVQRIPGSVWGLSVGHWQALRERLCEALARWHADQPDVSGVAATVLAPGLRTVLLRAALDSLVEAGSLQREGLRYRLTGHMAQLSDADADLLARVTQCLAPAGLRPPIVGELATLLGLPQPALLEFLGRAHRLGHLLRVAPNRFYLPPTVAELVRHARELAAESADGGVDAAAYRDRTGIGRNLTVQVLEFLDREGLTRFDGKRHRPVD